ncbi:MAG: resistance to Congo red protein, partial [Pseudoclavibacter sp.]|nr:resistance to Congo red protein [Pseudoclavibacter sp.]
MSIRTLAGTLAAAASSQAGAWWPWLLGGLFLAACLVFCLVVFLSAKRRRRLGLFIGAWFALAVLLLTVAFTVSAWLYGNGSWPDFSDGQTLRQVSPTAVSLATVFAGAIGIAMAVKRQESTERAHELDRNQDDRDRVAALRDRFRSAGEQLGHDSLAIRIAGAYALSALADDWLQRSISHPNAEARTSARREVQVCIDLLCAYLRTPRKEPIEYDEDGKPQVSPSQAAETEVRTTIVSIIADHLRSPSEETPPKWSGFTFNLRNAVFDHGEFSFQEIQVPEGTLLDFRGAHFTSGTVTFDEARFTGGTVTFIGVKGDKLVKV